MAATRTEDLVVRQPLSVAIKRLTTFVCRMEQRYECPSTVAAEAVRLGQMKETAEVAAWLISYRTLQRLRVHAGREAGMSTMTTD